MKTIKMSLANMQGQLSRAEMKNIMAGSGYCDTLQELANGDYAQNNWTSQEWDSWANAWEAHCH